MWSIVRFDASTGKITEHVDHWSIEVALGPTPGLAPFYPASLRCGARAPRP